MSSPSSPSSTPHTPTPSTARSPRHLNISLPSSSSTRARKISGELTPTAEEQQQEALGLEIGFRARGIFHRTKNDDSSNALATSWWEDSNDEAVQQRRQRRVIQLPPEHEIALLRTKAAVSKALGKSLDIALDVTREVVEIGADVLEFAPAVGLSTCARILVNIWDHVQDVETNKLSCLALTERCANILYSIKAEIEIVGEGDDALAESLREPVEKLTESFRRIEEFISKQVSRPFLKRYLKRDEDARKILYLEASLTDTVSLFNVAIQLRMLKGIHELGHMSKFPQDSPIVEKIIQMESTSASPLVPRSAAAQWSSQEIIAAIAAIRSVEAAQNSIHDAADLHAAMRIALRSADDAKILELWEIDKNEIQEAIKTIQRALEDPKLLTPNARAEIESGGGYITTTNTTTNTGAPTTVVSSAATPGLGETQFSWPLNIPIPAPASATLTESTAPSIPPLSAVTWAPDQDAAFHREFLESGLDALCRLSVVPRDKAVSTGTTGVRPSTATDSRLDANVRAAAGGVDAGGGGVAAGVGESLPHWTITKWEVDRENKIGWGVFSDVYKGTWRGQTVAIKVLARTTARKLFKNEISIWASLDHPNVLKLLGASSTTCDPPWFFVSPYMKNGTAEMFLRNKGISGIGASGRKTTVYPTPLQMMYEIAVGMAYLHRKGVLHGDLKANNILIDDNFHCVISDFGQSKLRSEVYRLSQTNEGRGNLRWQAPEIMSGQSNLTAQADVYSYGIVCYEILSGGQVPWAMLDDQTVQRLVLGHDKRPAVPFSSETPRSLIDLIDESWHKDPLVRPLFANIVKRLAVLLGSGTGNGAMSPSPLRRIQELAQEGVAVERQRVSPDMAPVDLPPDVLDVGAPLSLTTSRNSVLSEPAFDTLGNSISTLGGSGLGFEPGMGGAPLSKTMSSISAEPQSSAPPPPYTYIFSGKNQGGGDKEKEKEKETEKETDTTLTRSSSMHSWLIHSASSESDSAAAIWGNRLGSPLAGAMPDPEVLERWDERRYRLLLQHDFHPTLILPLWTPSHVQLGDIGYLSKPAGKFVKFFSCLHPFEAADKRVHGMGSIHGYGNYREASSRIHTSSGGGIISGSGSGVGDENQQHAKRKNFAQIGRDIVKGLLPGKGASPGSGSGSSANNVKKTVSNRLRAGHRHAYLITEYTTYKYMVDIDIAKAWFKANIRTVWKLFGRELGLHREDIILVIGSLEAREYALFVSHENPDGQVHFDVLADGSRKVGVEWGSFRTDSGLPDSVVEPGEGPRDAAVDSGLSFVNSRKVSRARSGSVSSRSGTGTGSGGGDSEMDCVLLARLRFKPDENEPTRL